RRRDLRGRLLTGVDGRLHRGAESHAAHARSRTVPRSAVGVRLRAPAECGAAECGRVRDAGARSDDPGRCGGLAGACHRDQRAPGRAGAHPVSARSASRRRETKETRIEVDVTVDGIGAAQITLPLPFFAHMLEAFIKYSGMDVRL